MGYNEIPVLNGGFAPIDQELTLDLTDIEGGGTLLTYDVEANVGGKIAQLGARLIDGVAKKNADQFFATFAQVCTPAA